MPKPWDIPPRPTTYDKDSEVLFAAVGAALSAWQYVEDGIASIFQLVLDAAPKGGAYLNSMSPAERAYGSIVSFDGRAGMVEAAAEAFFDENKSPNLHARLGKLLKVCRGWSSRRNEIAHGQIGGSPIDLNLCALWPSEYSSRKRQVDYRAAFIYNSAQIKEFERQFFDLHEQLLDFWHDFRAWRQGPSEEDLEQIHERMLRSEENSNRSASILAAAPIISAVISVSLLQNADAAMARQKGISGRNRSPIGEALASDASQRAIKSGLIVNAESRHDLNSGNRIRQGSGEGAFRLQCWYTPFMPRLKIE